MFQKAKKNTNKKKVCKVFGDYMERSPYIDLLWSDKLGYILAQMNAKKGEIVESQVISDAGSLCWIMFHEVAGEVLQRTNKEHALYEADAAERDEIEKTLMPYAEQLPEYRDFYGRLFERP